jgi:hypothetical protein
MSHGRLLGVVAFVFSVPLLPVSAEPIERPEFTRMVAHWAEYADPQYLAFIEEARPEVVQVGFYGAHFWSLAHTPHGKGYPAHFPVVGLAECGQWFEKLNGEIHRRGAKVVGHFNVEFLVGDPDSPEGPRGFFRFYRDLWDEAKLGPRPVANPIELLQKNADGTPIVHNSYSIGGMKEYWGCLANPHWRAVLKAWVCAGVARGVDGFVANYFYRHNCLCVHCQAAFRNYLSDQFTAAELAERFDIGDLATHKFAEIVGWHDPKQSSPLRREMLRFSQITTKRAFDEVFVEYGRSLKPDLILGQWNHIGDFNQINGDERCMLPSDLWGRGEDYLWYSTGGAACFTDLAEGVLGEGTLQARYIRGAFDDKPFTLGKYEQTRIRSAIAELAANGGAPMGFYTRFTAPAARQEIVRYYQFLARYDAIYRASRSHAEVLLTFPRSRVHQGDVAAVDAFKRIGRQLLDQHVLFDVRPDDLATPDVRSAYRSVFDGAAGEMPIELPAGLSRFDAPATVRVSVNRSRAASELTIHFVNYNRVEPAERRSAGRGIEDEQPLAASAIRAELVLPPGCRVTGVQAISPEAADPADLPFDATEGRLRFTMPGFLVYGVARVQCATK